MRLQDLFDAMSDHNKHIIDGLSIAATVGALVQWLPSIAALLSIIWTAIRVYETKTVQGWLGRSPPE